MCACGLWGWVIISVEGMVSGEGDGAYFAPCEFEGSTEMGFSVVDKPFGSVVAVFWSLGVGVLGCEAVAD